MKAYITNFGRGHTKETGNRNFRELLSAWVTEWNLRCSIRNMCSAQADTSSRKLRLRCGCQFPWCALGLRLPFNSQLVLLHWYVKYVISRINARQFNTSVKRWQQVLILPSPDSSGSSQRADTASNVGVGVLVEWSCVTLYRRPPRSGRARKPSSYCGMASNPVLTPERFAQH
jgi:hypothetical protein